jgi:antitoxin HicB
MADYAIIVHELSHEDGGGYLAIVPDLPGCMSDGATPDEARRNAREASRTGSRSRAI